MEKRAELSHKSNWGVLLPASILALVNSAALLFGFWMLFIVCFAPKDHHENWALAGVVLFSMYGLTLMGLLLIATILAAVFEKRLAWACKVVLLLLVGVGVVANVIAVAWLWAV
jgi:hypothetical protein